VIGKLGLEIIVFEGQEPSLGEEAVVLGESLAHFHEVLPKRILAGYDLYSGELVDPLVRFKLGQGVRANGEIKPADVPVINHVAARENV